MLILFAVLFITAPVQAAFQSQPSTPAATPRPRWAVEIQGRYTGSFLNSADEARSSSMLLIGQAAFRASDRMVIQGVWGFNQILEPSQQFTLTNPEFRMFYLAMGKTQGWSLRVGPTAALPLSQTAQDESLYFAIGAAARLTYNTQDEEQLGFRCFYDFGFNRNVHQYETSNTAQSNTMSSIDHLFYFEYVFDSPWSIDASVGFSSAWTYLSVISNAYLLEQEVNYAINDHWEATLGHARGGDFLSPNGQSYTFGLFDAQDSRFFVAMKLKL